jgi:malonyl-CoA O-methyltransferase
MDTAGDRAPRWRTWLYGLAGRGTPHRLSAGQGYDLWAEQYDQDLRNPVIDLEDRAVMRLMPDLGGKRVLDAGCGTGRYTVRALQQQARFAVSLDLSVGMLRQVRQKGGSRLVRADVCALPVPEAGFDVVICAFMLEHTRDFRRAVAELGRVTAPGGTILLTDFHPFASLMGWQRAFRRAEHGAVRVYTIEHTPHLYEEYVDACGRAGLTIETALEPRIDESVRPYYEASGRLDLYKRQKGLPAVLILKLKKGRG